MSTLPTDIPFSGCQTGTGQKPDLLAVAGEEEQALPVGPIIAATNDAAFDHGITAEPRCDGEVDPKRAIPWL